MREGRTLGRDPIKQKSLTRGLSLPQGCYTVSVAKHRFWLVKAVVTDRNSRTFGKINSCRAKAPASPGFSPGMANHAPNLVV